MYTTHNSPRHAQVTKTFKNAIPLKIRQGMCYTLELIQALHAQNDNENAWIFYVRYFQEKRKYFHKFSRTLRCSKTEKLALLHKYATNFNTFSRSV